MSEITQIVYVINTRKSKTLIGYSIEKYEKMKGTLKKSGYREATQKEIEAVHGKLEPVKQVKPVKKVNNEELAVYRPVDETHIGVDEKNPEPTETKQDSETSKIE